MNQPSSTFEDMAKLEYEAMAHSFEDIPRSESLRQIPEIGNFANYMGRLTLLEPFYSKMEQNGWEPVVEFSPKGLSLEQSDHLLTGHDLGDGLKSEGITCGWAEYWSTLNPAACKSADPEPQPITWDVAVTSNTDEPCLPSVSADGQHGHRSAEAIDAIKDLLNINVSEPNPQQRRRLISMASPTVDIYNMLQLRRLTRGLQPLDYSENHQTKTLLRPTIQVAIGKRITTGYWHKEKRAVGLGYYSLGHQAARIGVRPSVSANDLLFRQQARACTEPVISQ